MLGISDGNERMDFLDQFLLLIIVEVHVPFGKTSFSCSILNQNKPNLQAR